MLKETLVVWIIFVGLVRLADFLGGRVFSAEVAGLLTAILGLYLPLFIYFKKKEKIAFLDRSLGQFGGSLLVFIFFSLIIFPLAVAGNHFYQALRDFPYHAGPMAGPLLVFAGNLAMIALPEEFFFRGYMQDRLNIVFRKRVRLLGVRVGCSLPLVALLFALSHSLIHFQGWQILIFFPAMAFGWLREKTGTLTAPICFHAACNFFSHWVWVHYGA